MTDDYQPLRGLSDGIGRLERDLERLDRKVDSFITQHQAKHDMEQQAFRAHLLNSAKANEQAQGLSDRVKAHDGLMLAIDKRLETLELERALVIGAWRLMKFVLGALDRVRADRTRRAATCPLRRLHSGSYGPT